MKLFAIMAVLLASQFSFAAPSKQEVLVKPNTGLLIIDARSGECSSGDIEVQRTQNSLDSITANLQSLKFASSNKPDATAEFISVIQSRVSPSCSAEVKAASSRPSGTVCGYAAKRIYIALDESLKQEGSWRYSLTNNKLTLIMEDGIEVKITEVRKN